MIDKILDKWAHSLPEIPVHTWKIQPYRSKE
jgi:hypothetical protein